MAEAMPRAGMCAVAVRGQLRHRVAAGVRRFAVTCFDEELLAAVDAASRAGVPLALVVPLPTADLPVLLGAAALVAEVVRTKRPNAQATVVSRRLSQRADYDQLYIDTTRMADVFPRARLTPGGEIEVVGRPRNDIGGRMVMTSYPERVMGLPGSLVVDSTCGDPLEIPALVRHASGSLVYLTDNPFDPVLAEVRAGGGVVWGFDPPALAALAMSSRLHAWDVEGGVAADPGLLAHIGSAERLVWCLETDTGLDAALAAAWSALSRLGGATRSAVSDGLASGFALRWAWGVFATFSLSATTPAAYDRAQPKGPYSSMLADAAEHARAVAHNASGGSRAAWLDLADAYADLQAAAEAAPKLAMVRSWLSSLEQDGARGLLVTRNRAAAAALVGALDESPLTTHGWSRFATAASVRDLALGRVDLMSVDRLLVTGPVPRAHASLLAAPPAGQLLVLAAGPWEAERALRQANSAFAALVTLRNETVERSAVRLGVAVAEPDGAVGAPASLLRAGKVTRVPPAPATDDAVWEPFALDLASVLGAIHRGAFEVGADTPPPARQTALASTAQIDAMIVRFTDGRLLLVAPNDSVYRRRGHEVTCVAAKALAAEDEIALVDASARHDLFEVLVDKLAELPRYWPLVDLVARWHASAAAAATCGLTHEQIYELMRGGPDPTAITSPATIGTWIRCENHPSDRGDVARFARAVHDRELLDSADNVATALAARRTIRRLVGRWLSGQIAGATRRSAHELIDPELQVYAADLLETVTLHQVAAVDALLVRAPAALVGMLVDESALGLVSAGIQAKGPT